YWGVPQGLPTIWQPDAPDLPPGASQAPAGAPPLDLLVALPDVHPRLDGGVVAEPEVIQVHLDLVRRRPLAAVRRVDLLPPWIGERGVALEPQLRVVEVEGRQGDAERALGVDLAVRGVGGGCELERDGRLRADRAGPFRRRGVVPDLVDQAAERQ